MAADQTQKFIDHFKSLWGAVYEASLNFESKVGEISISLNCKDERSSPPSPAPPLYDLRQRHRSSSYFRRQLHRRCEHEALNESKIDLSLSTAEQSFEKCGLGSYDQSMKSESSDE